MDPLMQVYVIVVEDTEENFLRVSDIASTVGTVGKPTTEAEAEAMVSDIEKEYR